MRKLLLLSLLLTIPCFAQYRPFVGVVGSVTLTNQGFAQYTSAATAKTLASTPASGVAIHPWAQTAVICAETNSIRWMTSGTPTASTGMLLAAGQCMEITGRARLDAFSWIETTASAVVTVDYGW